MTATATRTRLATIDRLRGLAVLLMVLDHVMIQVDQHHWIRYTATRLALPLFMVCAATVWKGGLPSRRRTAQLGAAIAAECAVLAYLEMAQPGPVALYAMLLVGITPRMAQRPATLGVLGLIQALYLPLPWHGYQPGLLLAYWALGRLAPLELDQWGRRLPSWLEPIGRRPLGWYCAHLLAIAIAVGVLT